MTVAAVGPIRQRGQPRPGLRRPGGLPSSHRQPHRPRGRPDRRRDTTRRPVERQDRSFHQQHRRFLDHDEPADSAVAYGKTTTTNWHTSDATATTTHALTIPGLQPPLSTTSSSAAPMPAATSLSATSPSPPPVPPPARKSTSGTLDAGVRPDRHAHPHGQRPRQRVVGPSVSSLSYSLNGGSYRTLSMAPICCASRSPAISRRNAFSTLRAGSNAVASRPRHRRAGDHPDRHRRQLIGPDLAAALHRQLVRPGRHQPRAQVVDGIWAIEGNTIRPQCGVRSAGRYRRSQLDAVRGALPDHRALCGPQRLRPAQLRPRRGPPPPLARHSNDGHQPWRASTRSAPSACSAGPPATTGSSCSATTALPGLPTGNEILQSASPTSSRCAWKTPPRGPSIAQVVQERQAEPSDWQLTGDQGTSDDPGKGCILLLAHHVDAFRRRHRQRRALKDPSPRALKDLGVRHSSLQFVIRSWDSVAAV